MLQCKNVTKKYMKMTAVNGVSIDFMPGRIYALLCSALTEAVKQL